MKNFMKILLAGLIIMYIVSPVDLVPGPIDDIIVALAGLAIEKRIGK